MPKPEKDDTMLQFRSVALSDKGELTEFFRRENYPGDQYSFANLYIWRNIFHFAICVEDGVLFIRTGVKGSYTFLCPMGSGDLKQSVEKLLDWCREEGCSLRMEWVPPEDKAALEALFGSRAKVSSDRDHADYIYSREKLCTLAGKKLHAKRNFIHRFREQNWSYEPITPENLDECRAMQREWCRTNDCCTDENRRDECCAVQQAFRNYQYLGFDGGCLRLDGRVVAFTMGEPLSTDTYVVRIEKAFADIPGAYPMINQQFVEHVMGDYAYVNREDDVGNEGLRKAKLSYFPERLLEDWIVEID